MPANFTYPGVYISEKPSGARAIPAAATSIAMFVGMADKGPFDEPTRVQSHADFARQFGETSSGEMALQVGQFFTNGGGDAYVMRIADGQQSAFIVINDESGNAALQVSARDPGVLGMQIRVEIDYDTASPERYFNMTVYRAVPDSLGVISREEVETHSSVSMDPDDARYVQNIVNNGTGLVVVDAENNAGDPAVANAGGTSIGGIFWQDNQSDAFDDIGALIDDDHRSFNISLAGRRPVTATLDTSSVATFDNSNLVTELTAAIEQAYLVESIDVSGELSIALNQAIPTNGDLGRLLEIRSGAGAVVITSSIENDLAAILQLGVTNGGVEIDGYSHLRPTPTGFVARILTPGAASPRATWLGDLFDLGTETRNNWGNFIFTDPDSTGGVVNEPIALTGAGGTRIAHGSVDGDSTEMRTLNHVITALGDMSSSFNLHVSERWTAVRHGFRIALVADEELPAGSGLNITLTTTTFAIESGMIASSANIVAYTVGSNAIGGAQGAFQVGLNGTEPTLAQYQAAFTKIESDVQIFNMMILPRAEGQDDVERKSIWGAASSFCAKQRAILFVDPERGWTDIATAEAGADAIKLGVNTRHSVVYWPRLKIPTAETPSGVTADPSGSMAGLYARTDSRFGTWRAPAGIEATLTGVTGTSNPMSNAQQGRLNPKALNAIRIFPSGITSWGARMMVGADDTGNVDDKYINVRRMMLFIENSLYNGLRFAVFKNNAEPLWASIRLAAGSFMNGLMMQGAFASQTKSDAYYVLCDETTTTANDINLGIVNIIVGFAPNKPAEFVHLTVTQIAGQTEV